MSGSEADQGAEGWTGKECEVRRGELRTPLNLLLIVWLWPSYQHPMGFGLLIRTAPAGTDHGQVYEVYKVAFQGLGGTIRTAVCLYFFLPYSLLKFLFCMCFNAHTGTRAHRSFENYAANMVWRSQVQNCDSEERGVHSKRELRSPLFHVLAAWPWTDSFIFLSVTFGLSIRIIIGHTS